MPESWVCAWCPTRRRVRYLPLSVAGNQADKVERTLIRVKVSLVHGLTSDIVSSNPTISLGNVKSGWMAKPRTQLRLQNTNVQLMIKDSDASKWQPGFASRNFLRFCDDHLEGQPCLFKIHLNMRHEYEVIDQSGHPVVTLPTVPCDQKDAIKIVTNMLEHVAILNPLKRSRIAFHQCHSLNHLSFNLWIRSQVPVW